MTNSNLSILFDGISRALYHLDNETIEMIRTKEEACRGSYYNDPLSEDLTINSAILDVCEQILEDRK